MKKRILLGIALSVFLVGMYALRARNSNTTEDKNKLLVTASFYPLYFFASQIGGELVMVKNITPAGAEPHDYEPSTSDIARIEESKLLIMNGHGFEPWSNTIKNVLKDRKDVWIIEVTDGLAKLQSEDMKALETDPHIWLDPEIAKDMALSIAGTLYQVDTTHAIQYQANLQKLEMRLDQLDQEFKTGLSNCKHKTIVTSHAAFGYLAKRYGLTERAVSGLSPEAEPSPRELASIVKFVREHNVNYIFFEELVSPRLAETLAQETETQILVLNPLEGLTEEQMDRGEDYFSVMRENLKNLRIALECQ